MKLQSYCLKIREIFWPILENGNREEQEDPYKSIIDIKSIETVYALSKETYSREESRRNIVEQKATIFIGSVSILITILVFLLSEIVKAYSKVEITTWLLLLLWLNILYFFKAALHSIKTIERAQSFVLSHEDFINKSKEEISNKLIEYAEKNSRIINCKVDNMVMAQEFFKRALFITTIIATLIILQLIYKNIA